MPIRKYSPELLNLAEWPKVDVSVLSEEDRVRYLRLEGAIKAACNDEKSSSVTARFGVSRSLLSYYLKRCTENHSDGRLMGFRALIPNSERKAYRSVAEERRVTDMGAGYAGAFQQLLLNYPASARWLEKKLSPQNSGIRSAGLNIHSLHKDFLTQLRKEGASIVGYPFNTVRHGYSALAAYIRRRINEGDNDIALLKYGGDAQISLGRNSGKLALFRPLYPFERVAYDEYQLPDIATILIVSDDEEIEVPIARAYFCPMVDFKSEAILGFSLAIGGGFNAKNIGRAFEFALRPPAAEKHPAFKDIENLDDEGFPYAVMPWISGRRISVLCLDNHLSHLANAIVIDFRDRVGLSITYGKVRSWVERNVVERIFAELQVELSRIPSTTGSGIADIKVNNPVAQAVVHKIRMSDLIALVYKLAARHNALRRSGLYGFTPNEVISKGWSEDARLKIVPKYSEQFLEDPKISVEKEILTVRGDRSKGRVPYVQLDGAEYTSDLLRQSWNMLGKKLLIHIPKDFRTVLAYRQDGTEFGVLSVSGAWAVREHTRDMRKQINRFRKERSMDYKSDDPVGSFIDYLAEKALKSAKNKKAPKITREANSLARVLLDSGNSDLQINRQKSSFSEEKSVSVKDRRSFFGPRKP